MEEKIDSVTLKAALGKKLSADAKAAGIASGLATAAEKVGIRVQIQGIDSPDAAQEAKAMKIRYLSGRQYGEELTDKELVAELNS